MLTVCHYDRPRGGKRRGINQKNSKVRVLARFDETVEGPLKKNGPERNEIGDQEGRSAYKGH